MLHVPTGLYSLLAIAPLPFVSQIWRRSWPCKCLLSETEPLINPCKIKPEKHSAKQSPHRVRVELQAAEELRTKLSSFSYLAYDVFLLPHFSAQPPTSRESRLGKSWELGIHSPLKPKSDLVLAIALKLIKPCQSCEATKPLLHFILRAQEMLCFSRPVCEGAIYRPDFCARLKCPPVEPETLRANRASLFVRDLCNSECARLTTELLGSI